MPMEIPPYLMALMRQNAGDRAGMMRQSMDTLMPSSPEEEPMISPEIATLAGMPDMAQVGMMMQRRNDMRRQGDQDSALKLLSLLQSGMNNDGSQLLGYQQGIEGGRQFDMQNELGRDRMGLDVARMMQQGQQFGQTQGLQRDLAGQRMQQAMMELEQRGQAQQQQHELGMGSLDVSRDRAMAQLYQAMGEGNLRNAMAARQMQAMQPQAAPGVEPTAPAAGGPGAGTALTVGAILAAIAAYATKGKYWGKGAGPGAPGIGGGTGGAAAMKPQNPGLAGNANMYKPDPSDIYAQLGKSSTPPPAPTNPLAAMAQGTPTMYKSQPADIYAMMQPGGGGRGMGGGMDMSRLAQAAPASPVDELVQVLQQVAGQTDDIGAYAGSGFAGAGPRSPGSVWQTREAVPQYPVVPYRGSSIPTSSQFGQMEIPPQEIIRAMLSRATSRVDPQVAAWLEQFR